MEITFEQLPKAVAELHTKLDSLEKLIGQKVTPQQSLEVDHWYTINEVCKYLPDKPSKPTIYNWIRKGIIPYHKGEKKLRFLKSEIDTWLKGGKQKTAADYDAEANIYLQTLKNKKGKLCKNNINLPLIILVILMGVKIQHLRQLAHIMI